MSDDCFIMQAKFTVYPSDNWYSCEQTGGRGVDRLVIVESMIATELCLILASRRGTQANISFLNISVNIYTEYGYVSCIQIDVL